MPKGEVLIAYANDNVIGAMEKKSKIEVLLEHAAERVIE